VYLKSKIDDFLIQWKNNKDRLPLIIKEECVIIGLNQEKPYK
jgi:hypothetical protein